MTKPLTATQAARMLVQMADPDRPPLTPGRLQTLVFIAHGWHLAVAGEPLVNDDAEAWNEGPVFLELQEFLNLHDDGAAVDEIPDALDGDAGDPAPAQVQTVVELNRMFGGESGEDLRSLVTMAGTPWFAAREEAAEGSRPVIGIEPIRDHYRALLTRPDIAEAA